MGVEPTRNGATIRRVNHFTTATKLFPNSIAWRRMLLYYISEHSSTLFLQKKVINFTELPYERLEGIRYKQMRRRRMNNTPRSICAVDDAL